MPFSRPVLLYDGVISPWWIAEVFKFSPGGRVGGPRGLLGLEDPAGRSGSWWPGSLAPDSFSFSLYVFLSLRFGDTGGEAVLEG